jgi:maltose alpha-D-glucosyltransferase/alpha-amylase
MDNNPLWYKDAIFYELHVRAFCDSNGDGIGDFRGLAQKLDYLQDLGVTVLWLLPFYPSPLRDDGYDIADYTGVHATYGTLADVRLLVREAHRRGLRVVTELVCNHTSDQHAWFQAARRAKPGSPARNFYVWSDTPDKYREARIIFKDFETSNWTWDPVAGAYYWHRFYAHQPDLNFDNPRVRQAIIKTLDFWLNMGIDGLRLDAIPYLYEREGTNCENLPETHAFLKELRAHVDARFKDRMLLAEANQWPEDAVAYFGNGDECNMAFNFPVMPRLFMSIQMEDRFPIVDILAQTPPIPANAQWAMFLRNHDELTLEMVTDEERDYMYRAYAHDTQARINLGIRRRLAPLLANNRRRIELMNGLLFSLPGTPVIYYGDEIGMGDNIYLGDRNGVRTPMQWSPDRNAGFSSASPQRLYLPVIIEPEYHFESVNVESQQRNHQSLLWWMKRLIALRKDHPAFGRGSLEFLHPDNRKVLAFVRHYRPAREDENDKEAPNAAISSEGFAAGEEHILVVANLSRFPQYVELDMSAWRGLAPVEMFGRGEFPPIGEMPYFITLGPHAFLWFSLEPQRAMVRIERPQPVRLELPQIRIGATWERMLRGETSEPLSDALQHYLQGCGWYAGHGRQILDVQIVDAIQVAQGLDTTYLTFARTRYATGDTETYLLPLAFATGEEAETLLKERSDAAIAQVRLTGEGKSRALNDDQGILYEATAQPAFWQGMLRLIHGRRRARGQAGELTVEPTLALRAALSTANSSLPPTVTHIGSAPGLDGQQAGIAVYGDSLALRLLRRVESGIGPELELARYLTEQKTTLTPPLAAVLEYTADHGEAAPFGILEGYRPNQGSAWQYIMDNLTHYYERAAAIDPLASPPALPGWTAAGMLQLVRSETSETVTELLSLYLTAMRTLGRRSAELHLALAGQPVGSGETIGPGRPIPADLVPEPFTTLYQRSVYQSMHSLTGQVFQALRRSRNKKTGMLPEPLHESADKLLGMESKALERFRELLRHKIQAARTRTHGDFDLTHVLYANGDFVFMGLEADQSRPPSERRIKRSPLRDVAMMLWSFHTASQGALLGLIPNMAIRCEDIEALGPWASFWRNWVSGEFLDGYLETAQGATFLPPTDEDTCTLLDTFLLEQGIEELGHDLESRRDWLALSLNGVIELVEAGDHKS